MKPDLRIRWMLRIATAVALLLAPFLLSSFRLSLLTEAVVFAVAAIGVYMLTGLSGLPTLGAAAYFGLGGFAAGLLSVHFTGSAVLGLLVAMAVGTLFAVPMGWLSVRTSGTVFLMLSLAIAQLLFSLAQAFPKVSGGSDGLVGVKLPELFPGFFLNSVPLRYYWFVLIFFIVYVLARRLDDSPIAWTLRGIRTNPQRMAALGYNVKATLLLIYVIAGGVGALSGAMYSQHARYVGTETLAFLTSAILLLMVLLGGARYLQGAIIGAGIIVFVRHELSTRFDSWELGLGVLIVLIMYFLPSGLSSLPDRIRESKRKRAADDTADEKVTSGGGH